MASHNDTMNHEGNAYKEMWKKLVDNLHAHNIPADRAVVEVSRGDGDVRGHKAAFMKVFNFCKTKGQNVLVINHGGFLPYTFRDKREPEPVVVIGVPAYDTVFYISMLGRVAATGSGAATLMQQTGFMPRAVVNKPNPDSVTVANAPA